MGRLVLQPLGVLVKANLLARTCEKAHVALYRHNVVHLCLILSFSFPLSEDPLATLMP